MVYPPGSYFCVIAGQPPEKFGNAIPHQVISSTATTITIAPNALGGLVAAGSNITASSVIDWGKLNIHTLILLLKKQGEFPSLR